jgi:hypothetical protein
MFEKFYDDMRGQKSITPRYTPAHALLPKLGNLNMYLKDSKLLEKREREAK